jgi:hypothetical protein
VEGTCAHDTKPEGGRHVAEEDVYGAADGEDESIVWKDIDQTNVSLHTENGEASPFPDDGLLVLEGQPNCAVTDWASLVVMEKKKWHDVLYLEQSELCELV